MSFTDRKFGVELEFIAPKEKRRTKRRVCWYEQEEQLINLLHSNVGIQFRDTVPPPLSSLTASKKYWRFDRDYSVSHYSFNTYELVSPIMSGQKDINVLTKTVNVLNDSGCFVNKTCGLHVHVNVSDLTPRQILAVMVRYKLLEKEIDKLVQSDRRSDRNDYCYSIPKAELAVMTYKSLMANAKRFTLSEFSDHCHKISFSHYQTLEFRHHGGSLDSDRIEAWVKFCLNFVEQTKKEMRGHRSSRNKLADLSPIYEELYLKKELCLQYAYPLDKFKKSSPFRGLRGKALKHLRNAA